MDPYVVNVRIAMHTTAITHKPLNAKAMNADAIKKGTSREMPRRQDETWRRSRPSSLRVGGALLATSELRAGCVRPG
jgi:hypothetical protein